MNNLGKAEQKSLSKPNAMAYTRLKQNVKKELKNDDFSALVDAFRANPVEESEEEEEEEEYSAESEEESEEESESEYDSGSSEYDNGSDSDSSDSSDSSDYDNGSEYDNSSSEDESSSESSDESSDSEFANSSSSSDSEVEVNPKLTGRAKWVLQPKDIERERRKEEERKKKEEEKKKKEEERRKKEGPEEEEEEKKEEETYETPEKLELALLAILRGKSEDLKVLRRSHGFAAATDKAAAVRTRAGRQVRAARALAHGVASAELGDAGRVAGDDDLVGDVYARVSDGRHLVR